MMRIALALILVALTACTHRIESGDMAPGTASAIAGQIRHIGAAP